MKRQQDLYISDIDGTLLCSAGELTEFAKESLNHMLKEGLNFTVASARSINSMREKLEGLQITLPVIGGNGTFLANLQTGKYITIFDLQPRELKEDIYEQLVSLGNEPFISSYDGVENKLYHPSEMNAGMRWHFNDRQNDKRLRPIENIQSVLDETILNFTVIERPEKVKQIEQMVSQRYHGEVVAHVVENVYDKGWFWITLHHKLASKEHAVATLVKMTTLKNPKITAFGDNYNDLSLYLAADRKIAVKNAVEPLRERADLVIESNDDDGVVKFIKEEFLKKEDNKMPGFFDKIKSGTKNAVSKVNDKVEEASEVSKLRKEMGDLNRDITEQKKLIVEAVLKKYENKEELGDLAQYCDKIAQDQAEIERLNKEIYTVKGIRICSNCNTPATENDVFCRKCGAKLEELPKKQAQTQEGENAEQPSAEQPAEEQQEQNDAKTE